MVPQPFNMYKPKEHKIHSQNITQMFGLLILEMYGHWQSIYDAKRGNTQS